jgi:hypothetical protein
VLAAIELIDLKTALRVVLVERVNACLALGISNPE